MSNENIVSELTEKELEDFTQIITNTINDICCFSDKHNFDRNNMFQYFASRVNIMSEITTIEHYKVKGCEEE